MPKYFESSSTLTYALLGVLKLLWNMWSYEWSAITCPSLKYKSPFVYLAFSIYYYIYS